MDAFPAFFPLRGKTVIIAGEGEGALAKARLFENSPATVRIVAGLEAYDADSYEHAVLVFVAHPDEAFCLKAAAAARQAGVPVNVVDRPTQCDFTTPALIDRGEVVAAIGTGGSAPSWPVCCAPTLRLEFRPGLGRWLACFGRCRARSVRLCPISSSAGPSCDGSSMVPSRIWPWLETARGQRRPFRLNWLRTRSYREGSTP